MEKRRIIGVDIGSEAVKVLMGTTENSGQVNIFASGSAPTMGFLKGRIVDAGALAYAVKQAIDCVSVSEGIRSDDCVFIGVSGDLLKVRDELVGGDILDAPPEDWEQLCREKVLAASDASERILHTLPRSISAWPDTAELDSEPVSTSPQVRVHVVSSEALVMESFQTALQNVGIHVDGLVANPVVGVLQLFDGVSRSEPLRYLFLDVGAGTVDWAVYDRTVLASGSLPVGGEYITRDIMQGIGVSRLHAEEIKRYYARLDRQCYGQNVLLDCNDYGTVDKNVPFDFLYDIVESRVEEIVQLMEEHLMENLPEGVPGKMDQVFMSGGCSALPGMSQQLEQVFAAPVQVVQPRRTGMEYARPDYMACVGILQHAAAHLPARKDDSGGRWGSMVRHMRKLLGN
ncbi:MAG TPA: cell division FtsA domain-containing protein [Patescibacteria group bacterium]|nr:cell division FtsA domain-containing protein [Patescibacteria group bacterium]